MGILISDIKQLVQVRDTPSKVLKGEAMKQLPVLENAWLRIENDVISGFGPMSTCAIQKTDQLIDGSGRIVMPAWCDSHTHIVFAGNREQEFAQRISGLSYEEIAARGGGIRNSALTLQQTPEEELYRQSALRVEEVITSGTGALEIKSGYGLTSEAELKMLRVIRTLKENFSIPIRATYLAAHALPISYKGNSDAYITDVLNDTLPKVAEEGLADYIDIFCESGYFTVRDMDRLLEGASKYGLQAKVHVNQFNVLGGVEVAVQHNALSVDHLELLEEKDITALSYSSTIPVALPLCSFFLGIPYTPARKLIDAGLPLALATDYNPGSSPSGNMNLVVSTACIKMRLTPEEAINAATINGACAMGIEQEVGTISVGKRARILLSKPIPSYTFIPYNFGTNHWERVF